MFTAIQQCTVELGISVTEMQNDSLSPILSYKKVGKDE